MQMKPIFELMGKKRKPIVEKNTFLTAEKSDLNANASHQSRIFILIQNSKCF